MQKGNIHSRRRSSGGVLATTLDGTGSGALCFGMMPGLTALERVRVLVGGKRNALTLAVTCLATFVAILDTTVVNLALHAIRWDFRARISITAMVDRHLQSHLRRLYSDWRHAGRSFWAAADFRRRDCPVQCPQNPAEEEQL